MEPVLFWLQMLGFNYVFYSPLVLCFLYCCLWVQVFILFIHPWAITDVSTLGICPKIESVTRLKSLPLLTKYSVSLPWVLVNTGWPISIAPDFLLGNGLTHTEVISSIFLLQLRQGSYDLSSANQWIIFQGFESLESEARLDRWKEGKQTWREGCRSSSQHWCTHKTLPVLWHGPWGPHSVASCFLPALC